VKKIKMQISQEEARILELFKDIKDGTLRIIVLSHKAIPEVDIFLTEEEFVNNANQDFRETDFTITKELCQALRSFGFLPRAGFLSKKVKLSPYPITISGAIDEKDDNLISLILDRKQTIYNAQHEGLLSCKDDLAKVGIMDISVTYTDYVKEYKGWEPIYLLSQTRELIKIFFSVAEKAIRGVIDYRNKLRDFDELIQSTDVREESIQNFLEENNWIFGAEYIQVMPKKALSHKYVVDFLLQRFDSSWEIVELKLPAEDIFTNQLNVTAKVTSAISQIQNAQEFMLKNYEFLKTSEDIEVFKPRGVLVISNRLSNEEKDRLEIINKSYSDITIVTYQDLLQKARKQVELIEKLFKH